MTDNNSSTDQNELRRRVPFSERHSATIPTLNHEDGTSSPQLSAFLSETDSTTKPSVIAPISSSTSSTDASSSSNPTTFPFPFSSSSSSSSSTSSSVSSLSAPLVSSTSPNQDTPSLTTDSPSNSSTVPPSSSSTASTSSSSTSPPSSSEPATASAASSSSSSSSSSSTSPPSQQPPTDAFECNICFEQASNPVVSLCGHLYCWPCIHQWIESQEVPLCPVCKAGIGTDKVIPVYCRGMEPNDPRHSTTPNRPQGQRPQPERQFGHEDFFHRMGAVPNTNFHFSMGFGLFPSLFGFQFGFPMDGSGAPPNAPTNPNATDGSSTNSNTATNTNASPPPPPASSSPFGPRIRFGPPHQGHFHRMTPIEQQQAMLSQLFMVIGVLVLLFLLTS